MKNKIIAIGIGTDQKRNVFSGQAMMFEAFVEFLKHNSFEVHVINLASKYSDLQVGTIAYKRIIEYISIFFKSLVVIFNNRGCLVYITTAQSKGGFFRDFIFINLAKIFRCKVLIQQFGANFSNFYQSSSPFLRYMVKNTFNSGNIIVVEGEFSKRQFSILNDYDKKVISISNGLPEINLKNTGMGKCYNTSTPFCLIYMSYLIESKGYWDVLMAINILVNEMKLNVRCTFAGIFKISVDNELFYSENDARKAFFDFINEKGLVNHITYYEGIMGTEKASQFINSHAFLLPSYFKFEGQPVSVLEAMAYGSVPIVTNYRMISDMVTPETGMYVEPKSPEQIAASVKFLIDNPKVYSTLSNACVNRYLENFTLEKYCQKLLYVIKSIQLN